MLSPKSSYNVERDGGKFSARHREFLVCRQCFRYRSAGNYAQTLRHVPRGEAHASKLSGIAKNIILETTADFKKYAAVIFAQTVQTRGMPLGNETEMTDDGRAILGRWLRDLP